MPGLSCGENRGHYPACRARVAAKFPHLREGTTGWWRAFNNEARKGR